MMLFLLFSLVLVPVSPLSPDAATHSDHLGATSGLDPASFLGVKSGRVAQPWPTTTAPPAWAPATTAAYTHPPWVTTPPPATTITTTKKTRANIDRKKLWWATRQVIGGTALFAGMFMWCCYFPYLYYSEKSLFEKKGIQGRDLDTFLAYRFDTWMGEGGTASLMVILAIGTLSLLTVGGLLYWILYGGSPVTGMWVVFVWASAASVDPMEPAVLGVIGIIATSGGLILLAILLTAIADFFTRKLETMKAGRGPVVEGGHIVILGHSTRNKQLLEELAQCGLDTKPKIVLILSSQPKTEVEDEIHNMNTDLGDLKLLIRNGEICDKTDLFKVGADVASRIVIPEDPTLSSDESDAVIFGVLLTLQGAGWPLNDGYVAAQSCIGKNVDFMTKLHPGKSFVLSGERLGQLMVQGALDQGLCNIWNQLIGFSGDEFYTSPAEDLGLGGLSFNEIPYKCPKTIPLGIRTNAGEFLINPPKTYKVNKDDTVILLADDDDAVRPADVFWDYSVWASRRAEAQFCEDGGSEPQKIKVLICNFVERGAGPAILNALEAMTAFGTEVELYTTLSEEEVNEVLENTQRKNEQTFENIKVTAVHTTPSHSMAAMCRLKQLPLKKYDEMFLLADNSLGPVMADKQTVAMVVQMKALLEERVQDAEFQPMVEYCTDNAGNQLSLVGIQNLINTSSLMSRALAMVAIDTTAHGVLCDLLSTDGNNLDIMYLSYYLAPGEQLPRELNFAEATAIVNRAAQQVIIGWSEGNGSEKEWVINPKDKLRSRPWTPEDKLIVIKDV